jgi:hypothetical protein
MADELTNVLKSLQEITERMADDVRPQLIQEGFSLVTKALRIMQTRVEELERVATTQS